MPLFFVKKLKITNFWQDFKQNKHNINLKGAKHIGGDKMKKEGKYYALDVARYIINYCHKNGYEITNLRIQKLLYFVQAAFLSVTEEKEPCFRDDIEAWSFGPVVPSVYQYLKCYGGMNIPEIRHYWGIPVGGNSQISYMDYDDNLIDEDDKKIINDMVDLCNNYTAAQLVNITHRQDPWENAYEPYANNIIEKKVIKEYFINKIGK